MFFTAEFAEIAEECEKRLGQRRIFEAAVVT
jgi:hypothetical protein